MNYTIAAIGKCKPSPEKALFEKYQAQLAAPLSLKECDSKKREDAVRMEDEGQLLLSAARADKKLPIPYIIALDERGKNMKSLAFAAKLKALEEDGHRHIAFLIGGADGHSAAVRKEANLLLSFGDVTWPHMLVRAMLAEQLFRAQCINSGHPYHRE